MPQVLLGTIRPQVTEASKFYSRRVKITIETIDTHGLMITGNAAKDFLSTPVFVATVNDLSSQLQDLTFNTAINEVQKRQDLFLLHRALVTIVNMLEASAKLIPTIQGDESSPDTSGDEEFTDLSQVSHED